MSQAALRWPSIAQWNEALVELLLPPCAPGTVALLGCDDEVVRAAGDRLGLDPSIASTALATAVRRRYFEAAGKIAGLYGELAFFSKARRPRPTPTFLAFLGVCVLAASRMAADEAAPTHAYYSRLRQLLSLPGSGQIVGFQVVPDLLKELQQWLDDDLRGTRGRLLRPDHSRLPYVGPCIDQTVFRERDRQLLTEFFADRLVRRWEDLDFLLLLRRWPGRHRLTKHAQQQIQSRESSESVRAALLAARRTWDGSVLELGGTRSWQARLRLHPRPLTLYLAAPNPTPVRIRVDKLTATLAPQSEVQVPWSLLSAARATSCRLGATEANQSIRVPTLGDTVLFALEESGLWRVEGAPKDSSVWLLSCDRQLQHQLSAYTVPTDDRLPEGWLLFRDVPMRLLAPDLHDEALDRPPLGLDGGLLLGRRLYLLGHGPDLVAGDLGDDEHNPVYVDGALVGSVSARERLTLPNHCEGEFRVRVGDGLLDTAYSVASRALEPPEYGTLGYRLTGRHALVRGAHPRDDALPNDVCGATVRQPFMGQLPLMVRSREPIMVLTADGALRRYQRPARPPWLAQVGMPGSHRWEIDAGNVVWLLSPAKSEVCRYATETIGHLDAAAARAVVEFGDGCTVRSHVGTIESAREAWLQLLNSVEESH